MLRVRSTRSLKAVRSWQQLAQASVTIGSRWKDSDGRVATVKARTKTTIVAEIQFGAECMVVTFLAEDFIERFYQGKM